MRAVSLLFQIAGLTAIVFGAFLIHPALLIGIGGFAAVSVGSALERRQENLNEPDR